MIRKNNKYTQTEPDSEWRCPLPANYVEGSVVVEEIRDTNHQSIQPEWDKPVGNELIINFGFDSHAGYIWYSWQEDGNNTVAVDDTNGNTVNITFTQNGGNVPSGATFPV